MTTAAVVLAAGEGSRFTGPEHKLLANLKGKAVVYWSAQHALEAELDETIVVSGAAEILDVLPKDVTVLQNHNWADGQASSLRVAVAYAEMVGHDVIVVGVGDQPLVPASAWQAVAAAESTVATASFGGHRAPPVRLGADVWPELPIDGDEGARPLMRARPDLVLEVECEGRALDVDTLGDLEKVRREAINWL